MLGLACTQHHLLQTPPPCLDSVPLPLQQADTAVPHMLLLLLLLTLLLLTHMLLLLLVLLHQATEALRITAADLVKVSVMDEIIPEPLGGAHADPVAAFPYVKTAIMNTYRQYETMNEMEIRLDRWGQPAMGYGRPLLSSVCARHWCCGTVTTRSV